MEPVLDVVAVKEGRVGAPGEGAATVTHHQGTANGRRNRTGAAADVQRLPLAAYGHEATIACDPSQRFRGNAGPILQGARPFAGGAQRILLQMNHDLEALATRSRDRIAGQERLGKLHRPISPRGPASFRGSVDGPGRL